MTQGAQAHESYSLGAGSRVWKEQTAARAGSAPPRGRGRRQKEIFKTNAAVSRRPARGPAKPPGVGATGQSAAGTDMAVGVTEGGLTVSASARTKTARQSPNKPCWGEVQALAPPEGSHPPLRWAPGPLSIP
jgi:hypothetical protein